MRFARYLAAAAIPLLTGTLADARDLPLFNAGLKSSSVNSTPATAAILSGLATPAALATSVDARRGIPTMLWAAQPPSGGTASAGMTSEQAARFHLEQHAQQYSLSPAALSTAEIVQVHDTGRGGIIVVLRQRVARIEVYRNDVKVLMNRAHALVAIGGNLHPAAVPAVHPIGFRLTDSDALSAAFRDLEGINLPGSAFVDSSKVEAGFRYFNLAAVAATLDLRFSIPARVKPVWFPLADRLAAAYRVVLVVGHGGSKTSDAYEYVIAADDGRLLYRANLTHQDSFGYRVWAEAAGDHRPKDSPIADYTPHPAGMPDGSYPAFEDPILLSIDGLNQAHDPWLAPGATETRGNNVDAYTDDDAPDGFSANDTRASVTSPGVFDRLFDVSAGPQSSAAQKMAAVTQIFYTTNWLHDFWYDSGFDEAAGNAQKDNYGRGGVAGDPLHAEAQDGAPGQRNNADMSVLPDGASPRMQMFIWDGPSSGGFTVQPLNQSFAFSAADFSPSEFDISAGLVLADDGTAPNADACQPITNDLTGRIALIDRGSCTFKSKALGAQNAGAAGVVIIDNQSGMAPPQMGDGSPAGVMTIPVVAITLADGNSIKAALTAGNLTATLKRKAEPERDGTIDNTVVAHEWGHYIHLRQVECGSPACFAESEGWGDFFALHMLVREGDDLNGTFALSQYATASFPDDPAYFGIRRYPYSVDFTKNALTFKHITSGQALPAGVPVAVSAAATDNAEAHAAGEVWASMLFEAYVALLKRSQGPNAAYSFAEAQRRMADYVEGGLKLAPADPTFTEQRDAILAAAAASDLDDVAVLAAAFARRGAGTCAVSPARDSSDFQGVVEGFTVEPNLAITSMTLADSVKSCDDDLHLDAGETGKLSVEVMNKGTAPLVGARATVTASLPGVAFPTGATIDFGTLAPFASAKGSVDVSLSPSLTAKETLDIGVSLENAGSCATADSLHRAWLVNYDEVLNTAATDTVEPEGSVWGRAGSNAKAIWRRIESPVGNHVWSGIDFPSPSDASLVSPLLEVSATENLVLSFQHRYLYEESAGTMWDGSVIEISADDGKTWEDISKYADPGYGGQIGDPAGQANNPLKGRQGYVGKSSAWPAMQNVTLDLGAAFAGKTVRVRFRIGTDDAAGDFGWELDNIGFAGTTNKPFPAVLDKTSSCAGSLVANAGPDQTVPPSALVTLDGSKSAGSNSGTLAFTWTQTAGAPVSLSNPGDLHTSFAAPNVATSAPLTFRLAVSDDQGFATDTVDVVVSADAVSDGGVEDSPDTGNPGEDSGRTAAGLAPDAVGGGGCNCASAGAGPTGAAVAPLGVLAALLLSRRRRRAVASRGRCQARRAEDPD